MKLVMFRTFFEAPLPWFEGLLRISCFEVFFTYFLCDFGEFWDKIYKRLYPLKSFLCTRKEEGAILIEEAKELR